MSGRPGTRHFAKLVVNPFEATGYWIVEVLCSGMRVEVQHPEHGVAIGLAVEMMGRRIINAALEDKLAGTVVKQQERAP